jgi:hypothetical protein
VRSGAIVIDLHLLVGSRSTHAIRDLFSREIYFRAKKSC